MEFICQDCINVASVSEEVARISVGKNECHYCKKIAISADRKDIFSFIENNFFQSVIPLDECSPIEIATYYGGSDDLGVSEIWELIDHMEFEDENLATDLTEYLSDGLSQTENSFVVNDGSLEGNPYEDKWEKFIASISHTQRFFNSEVKLFLDDLFSVLHMNNKVKSEICSLLEPEDLLFRARVANTKSERERIISNPSAELGPVPPVLASDQRMTPNGISAFYASAERETCFSEVRAITGDLVITGEFTVNHELKLLDLRKLEQLSQRSYHLFDPDFSEKSSKSYFLNKLMFLLSKPSSNRQNSSYLETQVIFEYFRVNFASDISGLIFSSVQTGLEGTNVVLFPECSSVNNYQYKPKHHFEFEEWHQPEFGYYSYNSSKIIESESGEPNSMLSFEKGSLKLHYIEAVKTVAKEQSIHISLGD